MPKKKKISRPWVYLIKKSVMDIQFQISRRFLVRVTKLLSSGRKGDYHKSKISFFSFTEKFVFYSIIEAKEAFPEVDQVIIEELYIQANRNKLLLFEMLLQMANPEEGDGEMIQAAMSA